MGEPVDAGARLLALALRGGRDLQAEERQCRERAYFAAVFRRGRSWGAISKTNGGVLRFRDPIYRSLRELAISYFHEYCDRKGRHTLRSYSGAFDLRRVDTDDWVTPAKACWDLHEQLVGLRHYPLVPARQVRGLSRRDPFETRLARIVQYPKPKRRRRRPA